MLIDIDGIDQSKEIDNHNFKSLTEFLLISSIFIE